MKLTNLVVTAADRINEFKQRNRDYDEQSVTPGAIQDYEPHGWSVARELKTKFKLRKPRTDDHNLENRFWCCMYRLGYPELDAGRHFKIPTAENVEKQIDVFAKDAETVVIAECKTAETYKKKSLQKDLGEFDSNKRLIASALRNHYGRNFKPKIIWLFVLSNVVVTQQDLARARELKIHLLSDRELTYFEEIAKALGPAARQQFKAEYLAGQDIPALDNVSVPAVKTKLNNKPAYVFSCKASDMSRIGFVNHRDLRDPNSAPTYQRLVNPNRLKKVAEFLRGGGYFPNSILVNFQFRPRFDLALASNDKDIQFGHLYLPKKYKSVKIIDGQHRLYGCALLDEEDRDPNLFFVAFDGISGTEEANLFATINKEQQKVQKRLLDELDGELKWDSEVVSERVQAICSRAIDLLNAAYGNPFEDKVVSPGINASEDRPLTLPEIRKTIISANLVWRITNRESWAPGPFCCLKKGQIDNKATLDRLMDGLTWYFSEIRSFERDRWEQGKAGRICNNFGVPGYIRLLSEIIRHVEKTDGISATDLALKDLEKAISPFLEPVEFFAVLAFERFYDVLMHYVLNPLGCSVCVRLLFLVQFRQPLLKPGRLELRQRSVRNFREREIILLDAATTEFDVELRLELLVRCVLNEFSLFETPYERYVEPFLGGAAAFFALQPKGALLSDLNTELIATYRAIRAEPKEVYAKLRVHQCKHLESGDYYYRVRSSNPFTESSRAAKFVYLNRTCFNGLYRVNLRGEFNVPKGSKDSVIFGTDDFDGVSRLFKRATLVDTDFEDVLDQCDAGDFAFVDPPYTAKHNANGFLKYNEKIFSWEDQRRLAACIRRFRKRGGKALVTNAAHKSVIELYRDFGEIGLVSRASVLASETKRRGSVEELIVTVGYRAEADGLVREAPPPHRESAFGAKQPSASGRS